MQTLLRKLTPYVRAITLQKFERHGPMMLLAVIVLPFQSPPPLPAFVISRFGDYV
jgi:hypothetical protein